MKASFSLCPTIMEAVYTAEDIDLFRDPARIIVAGFSNSGKTVLVSKLIKKYHEKFDKIFICGVSYHPLQKELAIADKISVSKDIINPLEDREAGEKTLLVLDDLYLKAMQNQLVVEAFIKGRHSDLSVILITQNLFMKGPFARDISLNATHFILLRIRDRGQIENLARQIYGKRYVGDVLEIYKRTVLQKPYGYVLLDLTLKTPQQLQFRSNIVGEPPCELVYTYGDLT